MEFFLIIVGIIVGVSMPHFKARHHVLMANMTVVALFGFNMLMQGIMIGALVYTIAFLGSLAQILLPDERRLLGVPAKTMRIICALVAVFCGASLLYHSPLDLLAIAGFSIARLSETQSDSLRVKQGFIMSSTLFMLFAVLNGVWAVALPSLCLLVSLLTAVTKEMLDNRRLAPAMLPAE